MTHELLVAGWRRQPSDYQEFTHDRPRLAEHPPDVINSSLKIEYQNALSEIGTAGFDQPDQGDAARLWNLGPAIPPELRFSRVYQGRGELIDHILVSHALLDGLGEVTTADPTTDPNAPSVGDRPTERRNAPGSDHRPVLADLTT